FGEHKNLLGIEEYADHIKFRDALELEYKDLFTNENYLKAVRHRIKEMQEKISKEDLARIDKINMSEEAKAKLRGNVGKVQNKLAEQLAKIDGVLPGLAKV